MDITDHRHRDRSEPRESDPLDHAQQEQYPEAVDEHNSDSAPTKQQYPDQYQSPSPVDIRQRPRRGYLANVDRKYAETTYSLRASGTANASAHSVMRVNGLYSKDTDGRDREIKMIRCPRAAIGTAYRRL